MDGRDSNPNRFEFNLEGQFGPDADPEEIMTRGLQSIQLGFDVLNGVLSSFSGGMQNNQTQHTRTQGANPTPSHSSQSPTANQKQTYQRARAAYDSGNFDEAQQTIKPLLESNTLKDNQPFAAQVFALQGAIFNKLGEFNAALRAHNKAIDIWQITEDEVNLLQACHNINVVKLEQAKTYFVPIDAKLQFEAVLTKALEFLPHPKVQGKLAAGFHLQAAIALTYLGKNELAIGHHKDALKYAQDDQAFINILNEKFDAAQVMVAARKADRNPRWRDFFIAQSGSTNNHTTTAETASEEDDLLDKVLNEFDREQKSGAQLE